MIAWITLSEIHHFNSKWAFLIMGDVQTDRVVAYGKRIVAFEKSKFFLECLPILVTDNTQGDNTFDCQFGRHLAPEPDYVPIPGISRPRGSKHLQQGYRVDVCL